MTINKLQKKKQRNDIRRDADNILNPTKRLIQATLPKLFLGSFYQGFKKIKHLFEKDSVFDMPVNKLTAKSLSFLPQHDKNGLAESYFHKIEKDIQTNEIHSVYLDVDFQLGQKEILVIRTKSNLMVLFEKNTYSFNFISAYPISRLRSLEQLIETNQLGGVLPSASKSAQDTQIMLITSVNVLYFVLESILGDIE